MTTIPQTQEWRPADTFGNRLRLIRFELNLSIDEVSHLCGVASATWSTWERGTRPRGMDMIVTAISEATGCDMIWLMWGGALRTPSSRWYPMDMLVAASVA